MWKKCIDKGELYQGTLGMQLATILYVASRCRCSYYINDDMFSSH